MLWIHFCLTVALAQDAPFKTDSGLWSNDQVVQQLLPSLLGDNQALQTQIETKRAFFDGEGTFQSAFWQWQSEDVLNIDVLNALRVSILGSNQTRLQHRFDTFPFEESGSQQAVEYQAVYEEYWQRQNERDALDIKAIDALIEFVKRYPTFYPNVEEVEAIWLRKSTMLMEDETQQVLVSKIVQEHQKIVHLRRVIVNYSAGGKSDFDSLARAVLAEKPEDSIHSEGRYDRMTLLQLVIVDPILTKNITDEVERIQNSLMEKDRAQLMEEFQQIKQNWQTDIFGWDIEKTEQEIQSLVIQKQNVSADNEDVQTEIIQYKLEVLQRHQNSLNGIQLGTQLLRAQEDLDEARLKELEQDRSIEEANVQSEIVRLREIETEMLGKESERHQVIQSSISDVKIRIQRWEEEFTAWERLPPLDSSRRSVLLNLQQQIHQLQWDLQSDIGSLESIEQTSLIESTIKHEEVESVLESISQVQTDTERHIETEIDEMLRLWIQVHQRQEWVGYFEEENVQFWFDIAFEWQYLTETLPLNLDRIKDIWTDINTLFGLIGTILRWLMVGLTWFWIGRRVEGWWTLFRQWLEEQDRPKMFDEVDFNAWDGPLRSNQGTQATSIVQPLFFAFSACILVQYLNEGWIEVFGSVLLLWMFTRLCAPVTEYWISEEHIRRPLRRGLTAFVWIYFGLNVLIDTFVNVLYVFQSVQIVETIQWIALVVWAMVQLGVWYDLLYESATKVIGLQRLKEWMNQFSARFFGRRIRSLLAMSILLVDIVSKVLFWLVEHSSIFGSTLAKNTIESTVQEDKESFYSKEWDLGWNTLLLPCVEKIQNDLQTMVTESKGVSGAMCLIADEGMGKSSVLRLVMSQSEIPTHLLKVEDIVRDGNWTVKKLGDWLCDGLKIPRQESLAEVCTSIAQIPNSIIGIDDIQRIFLRDVQGFEVINQLFSIIQATSTSHCWIVSCHQPTWTFWDSPSTPIRTDFFRYRYTLKPWSVLEVRSAIVNMIRQRNLSLDFSKLTTLNNPQAVHRAEMAFWRLLTDSTKGNPSTSLQLFKQCAVRTDVEDTVAIRMFSLRQAEILNQLDDGAGFVLACVLMHNRCTLDELCNSLQMPQNLVVSICRQLVASSLLRFNEQHYQIDLIWFPWVEANLAQKRFIGLRDRE